MNSISVDLVVAPTSPSLIQGGVIDCRLSAVDWLQQESFVAYSKTFSDTFQIKFYQEYYSGYPASPTITSGSLLPRNLVFPASRSGSKMPDYKQKIRDGLPAATAFSCDRTKVTVREPEPYWRDAAQMSAPRNRIKYYTEGIAFDANTSKANHIAGGNPTKVKSMALSKVYKKIESELQHMSAPAFFAEFTDVVRQFGHPFEAMVRLTHRTLTKVEKKRIVFTRKYGIYTDKTDGSMRFYSRKDRVKLPKAREEWSQIVASSWLEWSFGLAPLLSDAESAAEALARFVYEAETSQKYRSRIRTRAKETKVSTLQSIDSGRYQPFLLSERKTTETRCQYTVGLSAPPLAPKGTLERLGQIYGVTPANIIPAAYEAVPWSWLLDYFTNVQEILQSVFTSTAAVKWIVLTESQETVCDLNTMWLPLPVIPKNPGDPSYTNLSVGFGDDAGSVQIVRKTVSRTIPASLGIPSLYIEHPFDSDGKIANMIAVLFSRRSRDVALSDFMSRSSPTLYVP